MFVLKRDGEKQAVSFDKITTRISTLCKGLASQVDPVVISQKVNVHRSIIRGNKTNLQLTGAAISPSPIFCSCTGGGGCAPGRDDVAAR